MKRGLLIFFTGILCAFQSQAQLLSVDVAFPNDASTIVVTVDATKGNEGLLNHTTNDVYVHTGVITNLSSSATAWRYVKFNQSFTQPNPSLQAESLGNQRWRFTIANIREYYGVPAGETIQKIAILFRSGNGVKKQANTDGSDMYIDVYPTGTFVAKFISPAMQPTFVPSPEPINISSLPANVPVTVATSVAANITLRYNGNQLGSANAATSATATAVVNTTCDQQITYEAVQAGNTRRDTIRFLVNPSTYPTGARPVGRKDGITYENNQTEAVMILFAPGKNKVALIGDFNNWAPTCSGLMAKDGDYFWVRLTGLTPGQQYRFQYLIDDTIRIADPYSELVLDPWNDRFITATTYPDMPAYPTGRTTGIVGVLMPGENKYVFTANWTRPDKRDLVIYELLVRDFIAAQNWQTLTDSLEYIKNAGFNAIKLMPFNEFDGNESWGYNPSYFFAADKAYGTRNALKRFIDEAHRKGLAVIQDAVLNHATGSSAMAAMWWNGTLNQTAANNPYFYTTAQHPFNVFHDFNHNVAPTKNLTKRFIEYWLTEFKIDGFRWDLSKGFTTRFYNDVGAWNAYDQGRIDIWKDYNSHMQSVAAGSYCILEHLGNDDEEAELAVNGMMLWGKMNVEFNQNTMGYSSNSSVERTYWINRGEWNRRNAQAHLIGYAESHDEERIIYRNLNFGNTSGQNTRNLEQALRRSEAMAALLMMIPGPKMAWQFGELGYDFSINYCSNGSIADACRTAPKPIRWDYLQQPARKRLYDTYGALGRLRAQKPAAFRTATLQTGTFIGGDLKKSIVLDHADLKAVLVANFDVSQQNVSTTFPATGTWFDYTNGGTFAVASSSQSIALPAGEYRLYLNQNLSGGLVTSLRNNTADTANFKLGIFPNPVLQQATVKYELPKSGQVTISILNMQGQVLGAKKLGFQTKGWQQYSFRTADFGVNGLASGQYLLQLRVDQLLRFEKLVVQH